MAQRKQVTFGYLFHNMNRNLCFTIGNEKEDTWAIEYRMQPSGQMEWANDGFCAIWWAATHPANEVTLAKPKELKKILSQVINRRFNDVLSLPPETD